MTENGFMSAGDFGAALKLMANNDVIINTYDDVLGPHFMLGRYIPPQVFM